MDKKNTFKLILAGAVILLAVLPLMVTFSSALTAIFNRMNWYTWLQEVVVPFESRLVAVIIKLAGITAKVSSNQDFSMVLLKGESQMIPIRLEWNCLGWQSMILLVIGFVTGLRGGYTLMSKAETVMIGILGTFLTNLIRMALIVIVSYYWSSFAAVIIHDYFASFVAIVWMLFFWWFSYKYVLEERQTGDIKKVPFEIQEKIE